MKAQSAIAIIGIGCRFPSANDPDQFWQLLRNGADAVTLAPNNRPGITYQTAASSEPHDSVQGGFLEAIDQFDAPFFGISPEEALMMDPQQRLLLEIVWEGLEDAGQVPKQLAGSRTGVFIGAAVGEYGSLFESSAAAETVEETGYEVTSQSAAIVANRVSFRLNLRGPSVVIDTACSSSLVAVHQACQSLMLGESSLAIAGGINLVLTNQRTASLKKSGLLSSSGRCRTFDKEADGYVRSEGVGVVILKSLAAAHSDGDRIYAVIKSSAFNHNGKGNGLSAPNPNAQKELLQDAYSRAGLSPSQIHYIEAQGTTTPIGDSLELNAIGEFLANNRDSADKCFVGSVKTNLGNMETASGMGGLIKVALSLKHRQIPPNLHFQQPNPYVAFDKLPISVPTTLTDWPCTHSPAVAGVSASGLGGANVHIVLERDEANLLGKRIDRSQNELHQPEILILSAKSGQALQALALSYSYFLGSCTGIGLRDICYTASQRRSHFSYRLALIASDFEELQSNLHSVLLDQPTAFTHKVKRCRRKVQKAASLNYLDRNLSESEQAIALYSLAQQWLAGEEIDWDGVYAASSCQLVSVPTYPFERRSYWFFPSDESTADVVTQDICDHAVDTEFVAPETTTEKALAKIWHGLLEQEQIGIHDNFFELGGHSLLATQVISQIREVFSIDLPLRTLFEAPTVAELSESIEVLSWAQQSSDRSVKRSEGDREEFEF